MTNQEAIDDIQNNILPVVGGKSLLMAIEALKAQELPSAQPEKRTEERTETHACDLIDRRDAIDALNEYFARIGKLKRRGLTKGEKAISLDTVGAIKALPSAQPEQKTCEGCKHSGQWKNELEYGASCPCLVCKRRANDNYERSD